MSCEAGGNNLNRINGIMVKYCIVRSGAHMKMCTCVKRHMCIGAGVGAYIFYVVWRTIKNVDFLTTIVVFFSSVSRNKCYLEKYVKVIDGSLKK